MATYKRSAITKEKIFKVACELFCEKGYNETSIRDICDMAGVSISRVNYHFASKAELAVEICRACLESFHQAVSDTINNGRSYSFVTDLVALRFFIRLFTPEEGNAKVSRFYREIAREGIWAEAVAEATTKQFLRAMAELEPEISEEQEKKAGVLAHIYAMSLAGIIKSFDSEKDRNDGYLELLQDTYACLFLQMLDMPHEAQRALMVIAGEYGRCIELKNKNLTEVEMHLVRELDEETKRKLVGDIYDRSGEYTNE